MTHQTARRELSVLLATAAIVISATALGGTVYEANQRSIENQRNFCGFTVPISHLKPKAVETQSPAGDEITNNLQAIVDGAAQTSARVGCYQLDPPVSPHVDRPTTTTTRAR